MKFPPEVPSIPSDSQRGGVAKDRYLGWSDEMRMTEFSQTGDPEYLTPALAKRMQIPSALMERVTGATAEDVASLPDDEVELAEFLDEQRSRYGLDRNSLGGLRQIEDEDVSYLSRLFEVARMPIATEEYDKQDDDRDIVDYAKHLLKEYAVTEARGVIELVGMIRAREVAGVHDVVILEEIFDAIHDEFILLSHKSGVSEAETQRGHKLAEALGQFAYVSEQTLNGDHSHAEDNYLADRYFVNFCLKQKFTEPATLTDEELELIDSTVGLERLADFKRDALIPFEIETGRLALFGSDNAVLYIADEDYSSTYGPMFNDLVRHITYQVAGQYFARRVVADVPYELHDEGDNFINAAEQLGRDIYSELFSERDILRDYLYLQRADMREVIEREFQIVLKDLKLKEQVYFLTYLQSTTVADAQKMQIFTSTYGMEGLRTFLSLEKGGKELGDRIVEFGRNTNIASKVFGNYCALLDSVDAVETSVRETIDCDEVECASLVQKVRENMLSRAQQLLTSSVTSASLEEVVRKIEAFSVGGALFASAFKELRKQGQINWENIKNATFERVSGPDIPPSERMSMQTIWESHYAGKYPPEYEATIRKSFQDSFSDPTVHYYVFKQAGEVVSYFSSRDLGRGSAGLRYRYLGSFMSNQAYEGGGLGQVVLEKGLAEEQRGSILEGECDVDPLRTPIISKYFEDYGFVGKEYYVTEGEPTLKLERWEGNQFKTKDPKFTKEIIKSRIDAGSAHPHQQYLKSASVPNFESLLKDGYYLTRYFAENDAATKQPVYFAVLERPST